MKGVPETLKSRPARVVGTKQKLVNESTKRRKSSEIEKEAENEVLGTGVYPLLMACCTKNRDIERCLELRLTSS